MSYMIPLLHSYFTLGVIVGAMPNQLADGQIADAVPVMGNYNYIANQVNANAMPLAGGTLGTATITTSTINTTRFVPRVTAISSNPAQPTFNTDNADGVEITAQTAAITSMTTNVTGTPNSQDTLIIEITGTGSVAITWGALYEASTVALPTTTSGTNKLTIGFIWNPATSKWRCLLSA